MKKKIKKAVTLVELLVVIAILAILATVSIVGYNSFTKKARVSNDTVLVKQMNDILFANSQSDDKNPTMSKALEDVFDGGYDLTKLTPTTSGYSIVWDSKNDQMVLLDDSSTKEPVYPEASKVSDKKDLFILTRSEKEFNETKEFAHYLSDNYDGATIRTSTGIDTGKCNTIESINYTRDNATNKQEAIINTNNGETSITVNADKDTLYHYGTAGEVNILAVDSTHSYHEFGSVKTLEVKSGHVVIEKDSLVIEVKKANDAANTSFVNNGTVIKNTSNIQGITTATSYDISNLNQLCAFRDYVNAGMDFSTLPVEIKADIDMSSISWMPIGTGEHPFNGTINGNGHTLNGLTNGSIISTKDSFTSSTTKTYGASYGFIGIAGALNNEHLNLEVKNINFKDVKINLEEYGNCVGTLLGYAPSTFDFSDEKKYNNINGKAIENIIVNNVNVSGTVSGNYTVGGLVGKLYNPGNVEFTNCTNDANVFSISKAGGLIGYISGKERLQTNNSYNSINITLKNLINNGNVIANNDKVGGIVSYMNTFCVADNDESNNLPITNIVISNCKNNGNITGGKESAGVGGILYSLQAYKTGYSKTSSSSTVTISNCENTGNLLNGKNEKEVCIFPSTTAFGVEIKS